MKSGEKRRKKFLHSKLVFISLVETKSGVCTTQLRLGEFQEEEELISIQKATTQFQSSLGATTIHTTQSVSVAASSTAVQCSRGTRRLVTRSTQSPMLLHGNAIWTNETWVIQLKFIYSEQATKFCKISTIDLTVTTYLDKSKQSESFGLCWPLLAFIGLLGLGYFLKQRMAFANKN